MRENFITFVKKFDTLMVFIVLECLAMVSFSLANASIIFRYFGFIIAIFLIPFAYLFTSKSERKSLLIFSVPLVAYAILSSFSNFYISKNSLLTNVSFALGTIGFFFMGFGVRRIQACKFENVLIAIFGGLAILVLIGYSYTMITYCPFYPSIFKDLVYYYDGVLFPIDVETGWLSGFELISVTLEYAGLFQTLLATSLIGVLFISYKKDRNKFFLFLTFGLIGIVSLFFSSNWKGLLFLFPTLIFGLLYRFLPRTEKVYKRLKILGIISLSLVVIIVILVFVNALNLIPGLSSLIASNKISNKIFNTLPLMIPINQIIKNAFTLRNLFGYVDNPLTNYIYSSSFEFQILQDGGIFVFILLLVLIIISILSLINYFFVSKDSKLIKSLVGSFLIMFFIYSSFSFDPTPIIHEPNFGYISLSILKNEAPTLIVYFLLGYILCATKKGDEIIFSDIIPIKEEKSEEVEL